MALPERDLMASDAPDGEGDAHGLLGPDACAVGMRSVQLRGEAGSLMPTAAKIAAEAAPTRASSGCSTLLEPMRSCSDGIVAPLIYTGIAVRHCLADTRLSVAVSIPMLRVDAR